jgi:hypothetical protein
MAMKVGEVGSPRRREAALPRQFVRDGSRVTLAAVAVEAATTAPVARASATAWTENEPTARPYWSTDLRGRTATRRSADRDWPFR